MEHNTLLSSRIISVKAITNKASEILPLYAKQNLFYRKVDKYLKPFFFIQKKGLILADLIKIAKIFTLIDKILFLFTKNNKNILFVAEGENRFNLKEFDKILSKNCYYMHSRWPGGFITNWSTFKNKWDNSEKDNLLFSKKEKNVYKKQQIKLKKKFAGILNMKSLPDLVVFIALDKNSMAVQECKNFGISTIGLIHPYKNIKHLDIGVPFYTNSFFLQNLITNMFLNPIKKASL